MPYPHPQVGCKRHSQDGEEKERLRIWGQDLAEVLPVAKDGIHPEILTPKREIISLVAERKLHVHLTGRQFPVTKFKGNLSSRDLYKRYRTQVELWVCKKTQKTKPRNILQLCVSSIQPP